jgi:hypothetical protein
LRENIVKRNCEREMEPVHRERLFHSLPFGPRRTNNQSAGCNPLKGYSLTPLLRIKEK